MRRPTRTIWNARRRPAALGQIELLSLCYWPTEAMTLAADLDAEQAPKLAAALRAYAQGTGFAMPADGSGLSFSTALITQLTGYQPKLNFIALSTRLHQHSGESALWSIELTPKLALTIADVIDTALAPQQVAA